MTWAYLITFNDKIGTREQVQAFLDTVPEVSFWYGCMPHCVFFTSTLPANDIAQKVSARFGTSGGQRFLVVEGTQRSAGAVAAACVAPFQKSGRSAAQRLTGRLP